ncbi:hypothetical protein IAQ61_004618 [Plenodomus lingam]|uniref:Predicted protein n=1 Tax=Leptosphaeria maculans (strain JN3 / isolate v23.1.3 / race Av1-4-5-6-7-8) TaxID=985895 RepID=E4ZW08_LEPMJ|nr:predicted protein [Plenodomus lingam JN3]KAH9873991.1 hypothetical protein IAQ61_004618 [Plenodomus lingam]CBX95784.1 predicted protein [Plenodomus lingam JN3]
MSPQQRRQAASGNCPWGGFYQTCATGFKGCCLVDACTTGCPDGKDTTDPPDYASEAPTPTLTARSSTSISNTRTTTRSEVVNSSATATTIPPASTASTLSLDVITSISAGQTIYVTVDHPPTASPTASNPVSKKPSHEGHSPRTAAIVGGALGAIIFLIAIAIGSFLCLSRRKRKSYLSPKYPSQLIGSDMSEELHENASLEVNTRKLNMYRSGSGGSRHVTPQLDGREIKQHETASQSLRSSFAELPAEPLLWPGQHGTGRSF